jgi:lipopolysaccharide transport system permease protein
MDRSQHGCATVNGATAPRRTVIAPSSGWQPVNLRELWQSRELLYFLVWRDVKVRYKQTVLGVLWAVLQPVLTMLVLALFFGRLGGMANHVDGPYSLFVFAGLLPWQFFSAAVAQAGLSLVTSGNMLKKVYFPRLIIPLSSIGAGVVDFAASSAVMFLLMRYHGVPIRLSILAVPFLLAGTALAAIGIGTLLAALVIAYRDFRYVLTFLIQLWMFASPVAYPLERIPEKYRLLYAINPMAGFISGFRSALLGQPWHPACLAVSSAVSGLMLAAGLLYFKRTERRFADIV